MFSEDWDLERLNSQANQILLDLEKEGKCSFISLESGVKLPISSNMESVKEVLIICSGYPECAGAWSYSLLDQCSDEQYKKTTMAPYFEELPEHVGLIILNPHVEELKTPPDKSIEVYISQLTQVFEYFEKSHDIQFILLGYSLGGDVIIRFLSQNLKHIEKISKMVFIDPIPPSLGRRKLDPKLLELVDQALFYGLCNEDGNPGEYAEFTKMRLKIKPELVFCETHGEMPNLIWNRIRREIQKL